MVKTGLEVLLLEKPEVVRGRRVGLLTNYASLTASLESSIDLLRTECRSIDLFAPEHGYWSDGQYMDSLRDDESLGNVRIHRAYDGRNPQFLSPDPALIADVEVLLVDIQDVGARYYTYAATMIKLMGVAAELDTPVYVLDRPNPIGGIHVEGNVNYHEPYISFVGNLPVPNRHGMTIGELAELANEWMNIGAELHVVAMRGWHRAMSWRDTGLPWVSPSPNIATPETALVYPGTCLFEATNVSEGRGTMHPFEIVGAPWLDEHALADALNVLGLPGVVFRPQIFTPMFSKYSSITADHEGESGAQLCRGVFLHVTDPEAFEPVRCGMLMLKVIRDTAPEHFRWRRTHYEFAHAMAIDALTMTSAYQITVDRGTLDDVRHWVDQTFAADVATFETDRADFLIEEYEQTPHAPGGERPRPATSREDVVLELAHPSSGSA
jgi:uncharacterized protein YbbC (DUF1343 family)